ncbi:hypothetical protein Vau01_057020 [Virgisporangium aurantiacum]|uniref:Uncharacterized protein n=1 Tax=Virgisporangium aurantiacum TaxID=175570 RepID=A0A8J3Z683_9ACTN|nr:hypothetical protein Vau01_057020 [Virgisporangium aurantiacum]
MRPDLDRPVAGVDHPQFHDGPAGVDLHIAGAEQNLTRDHGFTSLRDVKPRSRSASGSTPLSRMVTSHKCSVTGSARAQ